MRRALREEIAPTLSAAAYDRDDAEDQQWRLSSICAICPHFASCRKQAVDQRKLSTLPYLSKEHEHFLRRRHMPKAPVDDEIEALTASLGAMRERPEVAERARLSSAIHLRYDDAEAARPTVSGKLRAVQVGEMSLTQAPNPHA